MEDNEIAIKASLVNRLIKGRSLSRTDSGSILNLIASGIIKVKPEMFKKMVNHIIETKKVSRIEMIDALLEQKIKSVSSSEKIVFI